ncbi:MAG: hypothetical protein KF833_10385 [Verrucomicrobiae bacterium]|nr:hypothetical protein [Verrucomicrobiae bacterium]
MSTPATSAPTPPAPVADVVTEGELHLGKALVLIQRVLPRLDRIEDSAAVQAALRQAAAEVTAACAAHERAIEALRPAPVDAETLALVAAAVAVVLGRPHRVLGVQKVAPAVMWVNAWAIEGRFQHYSSHKVR